MSRPPWTVLAIWSCLPSLCGSACKFYLVVDAFVVIQLGHTPRHPSKTSGKTPNSAILGLPPRSRVDCSSHLSVRKPACIERAITMSHTMYSQSVPDTISTKSTSFTRRRSGMSSTTDGRAESRRVEPDCALLREPLWTVEMDDCRIRCELRYHGQYGVEYRLFRDNEFYQGRGFRTREPAMQAADAVRRQLEGRWVS